jgi:hypothetical protein
MIFSPSQLRQKSSKRSSAMLPQVSSTPIRSAAWHCWFAWRPGFLQTRKGNRPLVWLRYVERRNACFVVRDHNGQQLAYVYFEDEPGRRSAQLLELKVLPCGVFEVGGISSFPVIVPVLERAGLGQAV